MDSMNVTQNVSQNVALIVGVDMAKIEEPATPAQWYWISDEGETLFGPFETQAQAVEAAVAEDAAAVARNEMLHACITGTWGYAMISITATLASPFFVRMCRHAWAT